MTQSSRKPIGLDKACNNFYGILSLGEIINVLNNLEQVTKKLAITNEQKETLEKTKQAIEKLFKLKKGNAIKLDHIKSYYDEQFPDPKINTKPDTTKKKVKWDESKLNESPSQAGVCSWLYKNPCTHPTSQNSAHILQLSSPTTSTQKSNKKAAKKDEFAPKISMIITTLNLSSIVNGDEKNIEKTDEYQLNSSSEIEEK